MARHAFAFTPRLLPAAKAAAYLGISESTLRSLNLPRRILGGKRLYDVLALDQYADALTVEGEETTPEANTCRGKFGRRAS
ncbi:helix-turn-helix domain-containing protein [Paracoccus hibiscisoli]|nr:helix-turn-helix domain-containing protein [Paracoccus hibiscisoli]